MQRRSCAELRKEPMPMILCLPSMINSAGMTSMITKAKVYNKYIIGSTEILAKRQGKREPEADICCLTNEPPHSRDFSLELGGSEI